MDTDNKWNGGVEAFTFPHMVILGFRDFGQSLFTPVWMNEQALIQETTRQVGSLFNLA